MFGNDDGFDEEEKEKAVFFAEDIAEARRGIPQGSAVSPLVAEMLLAPVLAQLPDCGIVLNYADNFLIMAGTEKEAVSIRKSLWSALEAHPAGPLIPKESKLYQSGQVVEFLGHALTVEHSKVRVEPSPRNLSKFKTTFAKALKGVTKKDLSKWQRRKGLTRLRHYLDSWSHAFALWEGADQHGEQYMTTVKETASSFGIHMK
jgi:hypothetical protein